MSIQPVCFIEKDGSYLCAQSKKRKHANKDNWICIGGKFLKVKTGVLPIREVLGRQDLAYYWRYSGIDTFVSDRWETDICKVFTSVTFQAGL
jgi:hypothetical protein